MLKNCRVFCVVAAILQVVSLALQADEIRDIRFRAPQAGEVTEFDIQEGLLIVDGVFIPPPYHIVTKADGTAWVGNVQVNVRPDEPSEYESRRIRAVSRRMGTDGESYGGRRDWGNDHWGHADDSETLGTFIAGTLERRGVVASQSGEYMFATGTATETCEFIVKVLNGVESKYNGESTITIPAWLASHMPALRSDRTFAALGGAIVQRTDRGAEENHEAINNVRLIENAAYPLSAFGMALVVLATGNLLSIRPPQRNELHLASPEAAANTIRFVAMIVAFSVLDLIWTILASQAGTMKELNPLGAKLINDPTMLVAFKLSTVTVSAGILFYLRSHQRVTLAAWWLCLVLTLLTARWLMFNSLLV